LREGMRGRERLMRGSTIPPNTEQNRMAMGPIRIGCSVRAPKPITQT
jgi:hypothetical protein